MPDEDAVRIEDGYAMIFGVGTQYTNLIAADKRLDITAKVLARLGAPPATGGPVTVPWPVSCWLA